MINLILVVLVITGMAMIFKKAGRQWWEAIIPVYSAYVLLKITKTSIWWLVVFLALFFETAVWLVINVVSTSFSAYSHLFGLFLPIGIAAGLISAIVLGLIVPARLSRLFGHGIGMSLGLIILPFIFYPILGFGKSVYQPLNAQAPIVPPTPMPQPPVTPITQ
jgi:hypothetical protein